MSRGQDSYFNLILEEIAIKRGQSVAELKVILGSDIDNLKQSVWEFKLLIESGKMEIESILVEDSVDLDGTVLADVELANEILFHVAGKYLTVEYAEAKDYLAEYRYSVDEVMLNLVQKRCANDNEMISPAD